MTKVGEKKSYSENPKSVWEGGEGEKKPQRLEYFRNRKQVSKQRKIWEQTKRSISLSYLKILFVILG